jgi:hypothetical protein
MKNPFTGQDVTPKVEEYIEQLRTVRLNARKAARSGNPAKREPARRVLSQVGPAIEAAYRSEIGR